MTFKKTISLIAAAAVLAASMAGCSGSTGGNTGSSTAVADQETMAKELAYTVKEILPPEGLSVSGITYKNDLYYASAREVTDTVAVNKVVAFDANGTVQKEMIVSTESGEAMPASSGAPVVDDEGNVSVVYAEMIYKSDTDYSVSASIITLNAAGEQTGSTDITEALTGASATYISGYKADSKGNFIINAGTAVVVVDAQGKLVGSIPVESNSEFVSSLVITNTGEPAYIAMNYGSMSTKLTVINTDNATKGKEYSLDSLGGSIYASDGAGDNVFYVVSDTGICGVKEDLSRENLVNLLNLGVDNSSIESIYTFDDGSFVTVGWSEDAGGNVINHIRPADPSEIKEKTIVTLGCFKVSYMVRQAIAKFNKTNPDYTIFVNSYADTNDLSNESAALTKFNNELLAGTIPDILVVDPAMPYDSYVKKGLFTDLYPLMDSGAGVSRDDIIPNILTAFETDGKLMSICPMFTVDTVVSSASYTDDNGMLTLTKAREIADAKGGLQISMASSADEFLMKGVYFSDFVDFKNGKCDFDNDAFRKLLEESKKHPLQVDENEWLNDEEAYTEKQTAFKDGKDVLYETTLSDFDVTYVTAYAVDDFVFTNFPTDRPTDKSLISTRVIYAISDKSDKKDAAWQFISTSIKSSLSKRPYQWYDEQGVRHLVEDDIQYQSWLGYPVYKPDFELQLAHALDPYHYYNEKGEAVYEDRSVYLGGTMVKVPEPTQEQLDRMSAAVTGTVTRRPALDEIYNTIIKDEAQNYWSGSSTPEQVASAVQSRVSLYMSEHY